MTSYATGISSAHQFLSHLSTTYTLGLIRQDIDIPGGSNIKAYI
jgi:hypothetical protein